MKAINYYWNDRYTLICFFDDVYKETNLSIAREAEYHADTGDVIVIDVFWDENDDMTECHAINPDTLKYYEEDCKIQPSITREEYNDIVDYVTQISRE